MGQPVVHFEVIGKDPAGLRDYYGGLFGWEFDTSGQVAEEVSEPTNYGFVDPNQDGDALPVPGGIGGGAGYDNQVIFYIGYGILITNVAVQSQSGSAATPNFTAGLVPMIIGFVTTAPSQWKKFKICGPPIPGNKYLLPPEKPTTSCGKTGPTIMVWS